MKRNHPESQEQRAFVKQAQATICFHIPDIPKGPNSKGGLFRMHWRARSQYFKRWAWLISVHCSVPPDPIEFASVCIIQYRKRALDTDNLYASVKPILDGLVKCRIIKDDSPKHCALLVHQFTGHDVGTSVEIKRLDICER